MRELDVISFHPGRQHNLEQAFQIQKEFESFKHITSIYFDDVFAKRWHKIAPSIGKRLKKRSSALPAQFVDINPIAEIWLLLKKKGGYKVGTEDYLKRNEIFQRWVIKKYAPPKLCIGFDTSSWRVFKEWKGKSLLILDLTIAPPQYKLKLAEESHLDEHTISSLTKHDSILYKIYEEELQLADIILCGSDFVKQSCLSLGVQDRKLVVLPYGADLKKFHKSKIQTNKGYSRVVFIGTVNYRKGADIALQAWNEVVKKHPTAELHFYGGIEMELPSESKGIFFHGYISQDLLIEELKISDISILPTFFEGSSLAIYQSMAVGLAVITTPNAGSVIIDKRNGLLIEYGSVPQLVNNLSLLLEDTALRYQLGENAEKDIQNYTWDHYGEKLSLLIKKIILKN
jgi:glycosyltransferase involved in cell wall biosynthesis